MKEIYFTLPYRRSKKSVRIKYGQENNKFLVMTYDGGINGKVSSENSPKEEVFDVEQEMLKRVSEIKKGLIESQWVIQDKNSILQPSFLKTEIIDGVISFEFKVDVDPEKLDERRTEIARDFVQNIDEEIETSIRKGVDNKGS
tara:strand:+ start:268 stop:696 length:429 start_codon:yes stop_codon:yes gene_type:complete